MISGFDHVVIAVRDLAAGVAAYEVLLGSQASAVAERDGVAMATVSTANINVELMAPEGAGAGALRLQAALDEGEGLKSLVFAVGDIAAMHQRAERVGLAPEPIVEREAQRSFRAAAARTHGARLFFLERDDAGAPPTQAGVIGIDHIVLRTRDAERAAALYGARLGLDMRLDREVMGRRLMFFRCGEAVLEIVRDETLSDGRDLLWGLSWRVADADAAQARLADAGVTVSDVRAGVKPGTRVFTVRDRTCGVPTLMIEQGKR